MDTPSANEPERISDLMTCIQNQLSASSVALQTVADALASTSSVVFHSVPGAVREIETSLVEGLKRADVIESGMALLKALVESGDNEADASTLARSLGEMVRDQASEAERIARMIGLLPAAGAVVRH